LPLFLPFGIVLEPGSVPAWDQAVIMETIGHLICGATQFVFNLFFNHPSPLKGWLSYRTEGNHYLYMYWREPI